MKNRLIAQILALVMIASSVPFFASCSDSTDKGSGDTDTKPADTSSEVQTSEDTTATILDTLPEYDFKGDTISILARSDSWWQITRMDAEELTGEVINDAIYNRNLDFETKYNAVLKIESIADSLSSTIRNVVSSGDDIYDFVLPSLNESAVFAAEDFFVNLNNVSTIDFSNSAWDQNAVSFYSIANKLYYGVSDMSLGKNECAWIYMFNKRLLEEFNLEDPYQLVRDKKWTFDKSLEMMTAASVDLNGNGTIDKEDMYGLATHDVNYYALLISAGQTLAVKDENDLPYMNVSTDRFIAVYDKLKDKFTEKNETIMEYQGETFIAGRAFLCGQVMACVRLYREMEDDFGIIPTPMYDETQSQYYTYVIPYDVYGASIPITAKDHGKSGTAMQALAILSAYHITPAYYDVTITGKGLRDEASIEMLDLILSSTVYDMARMYNWGSFAQGIPADIAAKKEFASGYARKEKSINKSIQQTIDSFNENKN